MHHELTKSKFSQHRYFVSCDAAITCSAFLNTLMGVFGLQHREGDNPLNTLRAYLVSQGPLLLVLDNFETPWMESGAQNQVGIILSKIVSIKEVSLIMTMRGSAPPYNIQWTKFPSLLPLAPAAAKAVFLAVNPVSLDSTSEDSLDLLLQELDYVPLALILVAQVSTGQSCQHMLQRWRKEHTSLLQMQESGVDRTTSVDVSISLSLESISMTRNPEAVELLSMISILPDGLLLWEQNLDAVATV